MVDTCPVIVVHCTIKVWGKTTFAVNHAKKTEFSIWLTRLVLWYLDFLKKNKACFLLKTFTVDCWQFSILIGETHRQTRESGGGGGCYTCTRHSCQGLKYESESKILQYFRSIMHNLAALDAFIDVVMLRSTKIWQNLRGSLIFLSARHLCLLC